MFSAPCNPNVMKIGVLALHAICQWVNRDISTNEKTTSESGGWISAPLPFLRNEAISIQVSGVARDNFLFTCAMLGRVCAGPGDFIPSERDNGSSVPPGDPLLHTPMLAYLRIRYGCPFRGPNRRPTTQAQILNPCSIFPLYSFNLSQPHLSRRDVLFPH